MIKKFGKNKLLKPILIIGGFFALLGVLFVSFSSASSLVFTQSSWSGGDSASSAAYSSSQNNWNQYYSKDSSLDLSSVIATSGLVAYWSFEDDLSDGIGANDGTASGSPIYTSGISGQAISLDGDDDYVEVSAADDFDLINNFTISVWVEKREKDRYQTILDKGHYSLGVDENNKVFFNIADDSEGFTSVGNPDSQVSHSFAHWNGNLYVGLDDGSVFRYDGGSSWTDIGNVSNGYLYSLVVYNGKIFGASRYSLDAYRYDGGTTWANIGAVGGSQIRALAVFNDRLYAGSDSRVYRYDGGTTWTDVGRPGNDEYANALVVFNGKLYCGVGNSGYVYRYDGGTTWTSIGQLGTDQYPVTLTVYENGLYGGTYETNNVYRYDGGTTWTSVGQLTSLSKIYALAVHNGKLYAAGDSTDDIYRYNGPDDWTNIGSPSTGNAVNALFSYGGKLFVASNNTTIYYLGQGDGVVSTAELADNLTNIVASYNGSELDLYVDGQLQASTSATLDVATNTKSLLIGNSHGSVRGSRSGTGEQNFKGLIDELRVYNRALSAAEVLNNYKAEKYGENKLFLTSTSSSLTQTSDSDFSAGTLSTTTIANGDIQLVYETAGTSTDPYDFNPGATTTIIYRSNGSGATNELASGTATFLLSIDSSGNATFSGGSLPYNAGVGDAIVYDSDNSDTLTSSDDIVFIHARTSNSAYTVKDQDGNNTATTTTNNNTWAVYRAYTSLDNAASGVKNTSLSAIGIPYDSWSGGKNLLSANQIWNIACYADSVDGAATFSSWGTGPDNYLRVYAPHLSSEVGVSQRHSGIWDDNKYRMLSSVDGILSNVNYMRIEGIQGEHNNATGYDDAAIHFTSVSGSSTIYLSDNILKQTNKQEEGDWHAGMTFYSGIAQLELYAWNNLIYGFSGTVAAAGISFSGLRGYFYNNTIYCNGGKNGFYVSGGATVLLKNNITQKCLDGYYITGATTAPSTDNNISNISGDAPNNSFGGGFAKTVFYSTSTANFHLSRSDTTAKNKGLDLSSGSDLTFSTDFDEQLRPNGSDWDIGADEYSGYHGTGTFVSAILSTANKDFGIADWTATIPASTTISVTFRTGTTSDMLDAPAWSNCFEYWDGYDISNSSCVNDSYPYFQYRLQLNAEDQLYTPVFSSLALTYDNYVDSASLISSPLDWESDLAYTDSLSWTETLNSGNIQTYLRSAANAADLSSASWTEVPRASCTVNSNTVSCDSSALPNSIQDGANDRFVQYKTTLSSDYFHTPSLSQIYLTGAVLSLPDQEENNTNSFLPPGAYLPPVEPLPTPDNPEGGFQVIIANPSSIITDNQIKLNFIYGPDTTQMAISDNPQFSQTNLEPAAEQKTIPLSSLTGERKLYVRFYTKWGHHTKTYTVSFTQIPLPDTGSNNSQPSIIMPATTSKHFIFIEPDTKISYLVENPKQMFKLLQTVSLGATHRFVASNILFPYRLLGKILLDVDDLGKAYYISPEDRMKYYLGKPQEAFEVMWEKLKSGK